MELVHGCLSVCNRPLKKFRVRSKLMLDICLSLKGEGKLKVAQIQRGIEVVAKGSLKTSRFVFSSSSWHAFSFPTCLQIDIGEKMGVGLHICGVAASCKLTYRFLFVSDRTSNWRQ